MTSAPVSTTWSAADHEEWERARVQAHLRRAERRVLDANTDFSGDPARRLLRMLLLGVLQRYRRRGRFPQNRDFVEPTPYFVDAGGTPCAVAHLLEMSGEGALVRRIARQRNHARVHELADEPRLLAWLAATGITLEEAALIQPSYCTGGAPIDCVCSRGLSGTPEAVIDGTVVSREMGGVGPGQRRVRVDAVFGGDAQFQVGDELLVYVDGEVTIGDRVALAVPAEPGMLPDDGGTFLWGGRALNEDGRLACYNDEDQAFPPLSVEEYSNALLATDCAAYLKSLSPAWKQRCHGGGGGCMNSIGAGHPQLSTAGVLLVLLSALVFRRYRSR